MATITTPVLAALPGGGELMWIFLAILVLFGGSKIPSLAKGLGQSVKEFKKASRDDDEPAKAEAKTEAKKPESHGSN